MKLRVTSTLRFWIDVEYERSKREDVHLSRSQLIAQILREFEEAGDAMRYLNSDGRIAWKSTPAMLTKLADAERDAEDDLADWL